MRDEAVTIMNSARNTNTQARLMKQIQIYGFAVNEAVLYLDTHPSDRAALAYYGKYRNLLREAEDAYISRFGPLTIRNAETDQGWRWSTDPWPWEWEAACGARTEG